MFVVVSYEALRRRVRVEGEKLQRNSQFVGFSLVHDDVGFVVDWAVVVVVVVACAAVVCDFGVVFAEAVKLKDERVIRHVLAAKADVATHAVHLPIAYEKLEFALGRNQLGLLSSEHLVICRRHHPVPLHRHRAHAGLEAEAVAAAPG